MRLQEFFARFYLIRSSQASLLVFIFLVAVPSLTLPILAQTPVMPSKGAENQALATETEYTLGAGDRIQVIVYQLADFSGEYFVLVDDTISFPLLGNVNVKGLTLSQLSELLSKRYAQYLKQPIVSVRLIAPRPLKIAIAGEVNSPGAYTLNLIQGQKFPSLTDLLQQAGGLTTVADIRQIQVRRLYQGQQRLLSLNLFSLIQQGNLDQDISLRDGDSVIVPTKKVIDVADTRLLSDANFGFEANQELNIAIVGEVSRPGSYKVVPDKGSQTSGGTSGGGVRQQPPRLTLAIQQAGGIKPLADIRRIEVRRFNRDGSQQIVNVNLWQLLEKGDIEQDVILQEGDTIIIPTATVIDPKESESFANASFSPLSIRINVVGEVRRPGVVEVPPNTPLNQGLLAAGGFDPRRADEGIVELIRLNADGTVSKRSIPINLAQGIGDENNPPLRNNDVIVVNRNILTSTTDTLSTLLSPLGATLGFVNIFRIFQ